MDAGLAASTLVDYAVSRKIIHDADRIWAYNTVLAQIGESGPAPLFRAAEISDSDIQDVLQALAQTAIRNGFAKSSEQGFADAAARIMGSIMPHPADVNAHFWQLYDDDPRRATDYLHRLSCDVDYVRRSAIERDIEWTAPTKWGELEITINRSKPEKDPRDIARQARRSRHAGHPYPACQLCVENAGYFGRPISSPQGTHPSRSNLRIVPITLGGQSWGLQYSPYAYYSEHCIAMNDRHIPMRIDKGCFERLFDFVDLFPHYFIGSNADLPIVGGSILSHDHFQGGKHTFPINRMPLHTEFPLADYPDVQAGIVKWPISVIRLSGESRNQISQAAWHIVSAWKAYDDDVVGIRSSSDGFQHNTVTPIVSKAHGCYTLDLALRCNITSSEHPLGVFHPHENLHHIKKENIGLIEVMGLAILPPRLATELEAVSGYLVRGENLEADPASAPHAAWAAGVQARHPELNGGNVTRIIHDEVGLVFAQVLEDAGVFKWDEAGAAAFARFIDSL